MRAVLLICLCQVMIAIAEDGNANAYLEAHNEVRRTITPSAANMKKLVWDQGLADIARDWASKCVIENNPHRSNESMHVGENILLVREGRGAGPTAMDIVSKWAGQLVYYDPVTFQCLKGIQCWMYTQIVWAETEKLGCAEHRCPGGTFVVCNYAPGSHINMQPYIPGTPCSHCAHEYTCDNGLCKKILSVP
ncbi:GLIPR1-like protein 1 [Ostrea edulis]|uniref:GLIPR1-like protein 1 n=1 Tax=Ostrea edulis TaxID=37623 RepID=UPI0024AEBD15|nr:GLIPR1-like protein 1 [Ostrea edulis]